jgi:UDP-glucose 4-epimerase
VPGWAASFARIIEKGRLAVIDLSNEHVLVTGASGFVGGAVVRTLRNTGARVTAIDQAAFPASDVTSLVGDLTDRRVRDAAVTDGLTGIVHLAAVTSVLRSVEDPMAVYEANVAVTAGLLELARARGVGRFLLSSTNAVVGDVGSQRIREDTPLRPLTPYGATKAACEMLMSAYAGSYGMATCALRLTNVYGPGMQHKDSFVARLMKAARSGTTVQIYGDGTQVRDFVHVDDVVRGLLLAWERRWVGPLIVGAGRSVTVLEVLDTARRITGRPLPATHVPPKLGEMPAVIVDIARARGLGYDPEVTLESGMASAWADFGGDPEPRARAGTARR